MLSIQHAKHLNMTHQSTFLMSHATSQFTYYVKTGGTLYVNGLTYGKNIYGMYMTQLLQYSMSMNPAILGHLHPWVSIRALSGY